MRGAGIASRRKGSCTGITIIHPPVDRNRPPDEVADVFVHVEDERDNGLIVSGAKVVATGSAITHMNFIAHHGIS
jgi:4-hydroxyphenylacetate 3-monooxygenase